MPLQFLDPLFIIKTLGLFGIIFVIFAESGLFFGFFLPGDSLLFSAGLLASQGVLPIGWLVLGVAIAAISGDAFGYWFGRVSGPRIFTREDSFFFHKSHVERARVFYERHGKMAIILARFFPVVRTFAPIVAGVAGMDYKVFTKYNVVGGLSWSVLITMLGYILGSTVPSIDRYIWPILILIIATSFIPPLLSWRRREKQ